MHIRQTYVFLVALSATSASAASYKLVPFQIPNASSITIAAINDLGQAVGNVSGLTGAYAFIGPSGRVKALGLEGAAASVPSAVNDSNVIVGTYYTGSVIDAFVWKDGIYTYSFSSESPDCIPPPSVNKNGQITYNTDPNCGNNAQAFAGPPGHLTAIQSGIVARTINKSGQVAGDYLFSPTAHTNVFLDTAGVVLALAPNPQDASFGGYVNDAGHVAGEYYDPSSAHGFLYVDGAYTTFDMPSTAVSVWVQGIDNRDDVVGSYADAVHRYAFIYHNGVVTRFGGWPANYLVRASVSIAGTYGAVSAGPLAGPMVSYLVRCTGPGC